MRGLVLIAAMLFYSTVAMAAEEEVFYRTVPEDKFSERIASFTKTAKSYGVSIKIQSCKTIIDVPGGENSSYGAFCEVESDGKPKHGKAPARLMICDDEMVGHFALKEAQFGVNEKRLARFVKEHCFGG